MNYCIKLLPKILHLVQIFIVGFPGENDAIWNNAFKRIQALPLTHIHSFTYSERRATQAVKMPNKVRGDIAKKRLKALNELIAVKNLHFRQKQQQSLNIHIEQSYQNEAYYHYIGLDQFFNKMHIHSLKPLEKQMG